MAGASGNPILSVERSSTRLPLPYVMVKDERLSTYVVDDAGLKYGVALPDDALETPRLELPVSIITGMYWAGVPKDMLA